MYITNTTKIMKYSLALLAMMLTGCATSSCNYKDGVCQELPKDRIYKNSRGIEVHEIHHIYTPDANLKQMAVILALKVQKLEEKIYGKTNTHIQLSQDDYERINSRDISERPLFGNDQDAIIQLPKVENYKAEPMVKLKKKTTKTAKKTVKKNKKRVAGTGDFYIAKINVPVYVTKSEKGRPLMVIKQGSKIYLTSCSEGWCKLQNISGYAKQTNFNKGE